MKKTLLIAFCFVFTIQIYGQKILLEEDIKNDYTELLDGRNRASFGHLYLEYGIIAGEASSNEIDANRKTSHTFALGYRYRYKLASFYAMGFDLSYNYMTFHLKQDASKKIPNAELHKKEAYILHNLGIEFFNRIKFGERRDKIGHFIDFGAYINWAYRIKHYTKDKNTNKAADAKNEEIIHTSLNYTQPFNYGLKGRLGFNRYCISLSYRMSDFFNSKFDSELPRYVVGLQIGLHK